MKYKFKFGDRVRYKDQLGTVIAIDLDDDNVPYGIWFDNRTGFTHDLFNAFNDQVEFWPKGPNEKQRLKECKGYWVTEDSLALADDRRIVIETDGKRVTANYYNNDKLLAKSVARCHPEDKFDFFTGAEIAFRRLADMQIPANGRYVYVGEDDYRFTRGKIYVFTNGVALDNNKEQYPQDSSITLFEANDKTSFFCKNFVKLV